MAKSHKHFSKFKLLSYVLAVIVAFLFLEVSARFYFSSTDLLYLPYYGLSNEQHNFLIWKNRPENNKYSTTTSPYAFDIHDEQLGWKVKPNAKVKHIKPGLWDVSISTNKHGLRGKNPDDLLNLNNTIRIGFIGASQTFGESVNDNEVYVSLLDKKLANAQVINFGVRGYGTDQMLLYYENEIKDYALDVVVLAFAFHHIPRNISSFTFYAKPYFVRNETGLSLAGSPIPNQYDLFDHDAEVDQIPFINKSVIMRVILKYFRNYQENSIYTENSKVWELTKTVIKHFANSVQLNNTHFILLNIEHNYSQLEKDFESLGKELGIYTINLGPTIRKSLAAGEEIQIHKDNHWSALGHEKIADAIYTELCNIKQVVKCI